MYKRQGNYDPNAKQMAYDESIGGYWTDPLPHSGKDGEKGEKGDKMCIRDSNRYYS